MRRKEKHKRETDKIGEERKKERKTTINETQRWKERNRRKREE